MWAVYHAPALVCCRAAAKKRGSTQASGDAERAVSASSSPSLPWRLRFSPKILSEDLRDLGSDAYRAAKQVIQKTLPLDPHQYGEGLRAPLSGIYKLKSSHVRIAYHIEEPAHEVWVLMIADRRVIWDRHEGEILSRLGEERAAQRRRAGPR